MWENKQSSAGNLQHSLISDRKRPQADLDEQAFNERDLMHLEKQQQCV